MDIWHINWVTVLFFVIVVAIVLALIAEKRAKATPTVVDEPELLEPEERHQVIDYRNPGWGHSIASWHKVNEGVYTALAFHQRGIDVNDLLLIKTDGPTGAAYFRVVHSKQLRDPDDMYELRLIGHARWQPDGR